MTIHPTAWNWRLIVALGLNSVAWCMITASVATALS